MREERRLARRDRQPSASPCNLLYVASCAADRLSEKRSKLVIAMDGKRFGSRGVSQLSAQRQAERGKVV